MKSTTGFILMAWEDYPHNPLNFSILCHFLSDFLAVSNLSSYLCRVSYSLKP